MRKLVGVALFSLLAASRPPEKAFSDLTNMTYRTIPGCLGIVKTQPAFKNALEHSLHVQAGLLDHILFINRNNRIRRNNSRAVPGLHSNELALLTSPELPLMLEMHQIRLGRLSELAAPRSLSAAA